MVDKVKKSASLKASSDEDLNDDVPAELVIVDLSDQEPEPEPAPEPALEPAPKPAPTGAFFMKPNRMTIGYADKGPIVGQLAHCLSEILGKTVKESGKVDMPIVKAIEEAQIFLDVAVTGVWDDVTHAAMKDLCKGQ
jgi:hypothetical protein